eukprot:m.86373 g.86373  ORF g.86373 m.86373 type:complete len:521 (+) comp25961_c0_seq1:272-1834(+)
MYLNLCCPNNKLLRNMGWFTTAFVFGTLSILPFAAPFPWTACSVTDYGAVGDGKIIDTVAINKALSDVANCTVVVFPSGYVFLTGSLHLRNHLHVVVEHNATILGALGNISAYDPPEPNPWDKYQDFGHSHWHNSLMWGVAVTNVTIEGGGTIDGGDGLVTSDPPVGGADKTVSLKSCSHVVIRNLTMVRTGHFALLATDVQYLTLSHLKLRPARDGVDLVGTKHVLAEYLDILGGGDDAFVLKSDFSVGRIIDVTNVTIRDSSISTDGATALEIGSETVGEFSHIRFANITVHGAGDAAIGIVTMDGSHVHDVSYENIVINNVTSPFQFYIGSRLLRPETSCDGPCRPGRIYNIHAINVSATALYSPSHGGRNWSSSFDGQPLDDVHGANQTFPVGPNITLTDVHLTYRGGGLVSTVNANPLHLWDSWMNIGVRPAWAWYLRNMYGLVIDGMILDFDHNDDRPAIVLQDALNVTFRRVSCARGSGIGYDIGLRPRSSVHVYDSPGIQTHTLPSSPPSLP